MSKNYEDMTKEERIEYRERVALGHFMGSDAELALKSLLRKVARDSYDAGYTDGFNDGNKEAKQQ